MLKKNKHYMGLLAGSVLLAMSGYSHAASVCVNDNQLVFNDDNIIADAQIWVAAYNNGAWVWDGNVSCSTGSCESTVTYNGGQVEFRVEGPGVQGYYSPGAGGVMHSLMTPTACSGGVSPTPTVSPSPTPTVSPTPTPVVTVPPTPTPTPVVTVPPTPTPTVTPTPNPDTGAVPPAIPEDGQRYFILGQDQKSINDYMAQDDLPKPAGLTVYVTLARGEPTFDGSYCFKGLDGLKNIGNYNSNSATGCSDNGRRQNQWGSGVQNVEWAIATYNPEIISIGLWCPSNNALPSLYNSGAYDDLLSEFSDFLKANSSTKFFLRTCYEFNGDAGGWSDVNFRETFKYVRNFLDGQGVQNVAHVWQSDSFHGTGRGTNAIGDQEQGYWPGKRFVDWVGSSQFDSDTGEEASIAEAEGLPHFIAEATPHGALFQQYDFKLPIGGTGSSPDGQVVLFSDLNWFNNKQGEITRTSTKAWHYINADWSSQPQWANAPDQAGQNYFKYSDTRVEVNSDVKEHFKSLVTPNNGFIVK